MKRYTMTERNRGEWVARDLSPKARKFYLETDPLRVYEIETEHGKLYDTTGFIETQGLTFEQLNRLFEIYEDALNEGRL